MSSRLGLYGGDSLFRTFCIISGKHRSVAENKLNKGTKTKLSLENTNGLVVIIQNGATCAKRKRWFKFKMILFEEIEKLCHKND